MMMHGLTSFLIAAAAALSPNSAIVVGGSSGMGKAAATQFVKAGGRALLVSRSADKLERAREEILHATGADASAVDTAAVDAADEAAVAAFAAELASGAYDALVVSAAGRAPHGPVAELDVADARDMMDSKFWTAWHCAKHVGPRLADDGSITFVAGVLNRRPGKNCAPLAATNGALEGLTRSLALDLGPRLRVNCMSPGFCDTERFDHMPAERKAAMLANTAASLPLQRVGEPADMGAAIHYLASAPFVTGVVLDVDGGHGVRQYADAATDPMRRGDR
jgi:NAD(P)-dependent dehydrogenase (short-subunit alcohol dehydrogenase family)